MYSMAKVHVVEMKRRYKESTYFSFQLRKRETIHAEDPQTGKPISAYRTAYVMNLGKEPIMSKSIARKLCENHDEITMVDLDDLVTRGKLKIVPDGQYQKPIQGRPKKQKKEVIGTKRPTNNPEKE